MTQFAIFATLLIVVVAAFLLPPLWLGSRSPTVGTDRKAANLAIFRDQLAELESEKIEGSLADTSFEQAQNELQRRLLEEVTPAGNQPGAQGAAAPNRKTAIIVLLLVPIVALLGYAYLGNLKALDPSELVAQPQMSSEQINGMVAKLAERMKANPGDLKGWLMLARSYKALGRYPEAAEAYAKAEPLIDDDPESLASYAETLAMAKGKGLTGKPVELINKALKLDAKNPHALFLAGAAAMEAGDRQKGIAYWEALLPQVEPGSEIDQMLRSGIEKMKKGR